MKFRMCLKVFASALVVWCGGVILIHVVSGDKSVEKDTPLPLLSLGKWKNCVIPSDVDRLCDVNRTEETASPSCPLQELSQDCSLPKQLHGYDKPADEEEMRFPLAFGLKMHTAPEQLLRAIYRPHNVYCIHVDKKADDAVFRVMTSIASCFPNVILTDRVSFVYLSYDSIRVELRTMACALQSTVAWKYYLNLAGQEFPLRTNLEIIRILTILNGTNDIESFPMPRWFRHRFTFKHEVKDGKLVKTSAPKDPPPFEAQVRKGTQYGAFSRAFVATIFYDDVAKSILDYFKDASDPDESVWATINSLPWIPGGYKTHVIHSPKNEHISRAVAWKRKDRYQCRGQYVREVCICTQTDLPWLLEQPNLFANKFRHDMDSRPAMCLEALVDQRARSRDVLINRSYLESLSHVNNKFGKPS
ncbi:beta-1,3-galactosyl-O-glycosyl-glycoprotein beta-1,6-N-acetylglucosaminyltransferase 3-like [Littorina saxatilis]|uniref:beta-1,3-galactosyl-O-glycosyl-glycoprotein beta-1,6-N-acetylglucosaminyltransferase 3-like n=1 Tax=Littorina saxatilis TaxID=31220 RepID=UPI0038B510D2